MNKPELLKELKVQGVLRKKEIVDAFRKIDRKDFVPKAYQEYAYINEPIPIGEAQTISQPYTTLFMLDNLDLKEGQKVLDIGTGSGYAAALIAEIIGQEGEVITIERIRELFEFAKNNLKHYKNIKLVLGDGSKGYAREAPYDRIIVAASSSEIPQKLLEQLKEEGILIIPINDSLIKVKKLRGKLVKEYLGPFVFVPLIQSGS